MTSPKQADELLPCPWCGSPAQCVENGYDEYLTFCPNDCPPLGRTRKEAIASWNRRSHLQPPGEWQWVPKEPTEEMIRKGKHVFHLMVHDACVLPIYKAMLAASPGIPE
jgi:hypothetical protein